jgi:hypothetical protein
MFYDLNFIVVTHEKRHPKFVKSIVYQCREVKKKRVALSRG